MIYQKKSRGHRTSKIVKSRESSSNGHLPYHLFILWLNARSRAWRGMWICVRSKDAQKQIARTSLNNNNKDSISFKKRCIIDTIAISLLSRKLAFQAIKNVSKKVNRRRIKWQSYRFHRTTDLLLLLPYTSNF